MQVVDIFFQEFHSFISYVVVYRGHVYYRIVKRFFHFLYRFILNFNYLIYLIL